MSVFSKKVPNNFVPIHPDNATSNDWIVVLEAGTITGPTPSKLRVAGATQERKVVKKYDMLMHAQHYLVVDGYNPRIHALYFCPQLFKYDSERKLVPLQGEEIGALIAQSVERGVNERQPWYEPSEHLPEQRVIDAPPLTDFDTVVVQMPNAPSSIAAE
jgi:hypothetical protein